MGTRNPLDRSAAHEALLYTCEPFAKADLNEGSAIITAFLDDFYASDSKNMYDFATTWSGPHDPPAPPGIDIRTRPRPQVIPPPVRHHLFARVQEGHVVTDRPKS